MKKGAVPTFLWSNNKWYLRLVLEKRMARPNGRILVAERKVVNEGQPPAELLDNLEARCVVGERER